MEIKIVNPTAESFNEAVGISEERANELGAKMDVLVKGLSGRLVYTCDLLNEIAGYCDNTEELLFCTISHCNYLALKYGLFLCPPKNRKNGKHI